MRRLKLGALPIPEIYIVSTQDEINKCKYYGIPYIVWDGTDERLIKYIMWRYMDKLLPDINWREEYGISSERYARLKVHETKGSVGGGNSCAEDGTGGVTSDTTRTFDGKSAEDDDSENELSIDSYLGDLENYINADVLQKLKLLPTFLMDITKAIKTNLKKTAWAEGYHKKYGLCVGTTKPTKAIRNLLIIDISGSMPRGITNTLLLLLNTLKAELTCDVIITGSVSRGWLYEEQLPEPEKIRRLIGLNNESYYFQKLLEGKFNNSYYNHIISFGDNDSPSHSWYNNDENYEDLPAHTSHGKDFKINKINITANYIHHYHADYKKATGYGKPFETLCPKAIVDYDTDWCNTSWS